MVAKNVYFEQGQTKMTTQLKYTRTCTTIQQGILTFMTPYMYDTGLLNLLNLYQWNGMIERFLCTLVCWVTYQLICKFNNGDCVVETETFWNKYDRMDF